MPFSSEIKIVGPITSISICREIINHLSFKNGNYCTHTLNEILPQLIKNKSNKITPSSVSLIMNKFYKNSGKIVSENKLTNWVISGRKDALE